MSTRAERLRHVWAWLPSFRVVAEVQQLTEAADLLGVTAAALSRTIAKLESAMQVRLFERMPRGMLLTDAGRRLADEVREAMRRCDDVLSQLGPDEHRGNVVRVGFDTHAVGALIDAGLPTLVQRGVPLRISTVSPKSMAAELLSGEVDLVLSASPSSDDRVVCKPLTTISMVWATSNRRLKLPPSGASVPLELPAAVAPPSPWLLQHSVMLLPEAVVPAQVRTTPAGTATLWRLTRTRPQRHLLELAEAVTQVARRRLGRVSSQRRRPPIARSS